MRLIAVKTNDIVDSTDGFTVSMWVSGCPHKCTGCQNSMYWEPESGDICDDWNALTTRILKAIHRNGIERSFSILGGEPMAPYNREGVAYIINRIKEKCPSIKIYLWSGYTIEELQKMNDQNVNLALEKVDYLIEGRFIQSLRDITLKLRGSSNQRIFAKAPNGELKDITSSMDQSQDEPVVIDEPLQA